jgi:hypothetical protein
LAAIISFTSSRKKEKLGLLLLPCLQQKKKKKTEKKGDNTLVSSPFSFQIETQKQKKWMASSSSQAKEKKNKPQRRKKMQRREGAYLFSLASAFGMKHFSCVTTLTSGLRPKQRLARLWAKKETQESHCMFLGV